MGTRRGTIGGGEGHERGGKRAGGTRPDRPTDGRGTGRKGWGGSACIPERRRPVCGTPARSVESRRLRHNPISSSFSDSLRPEPLARRRRPSSSRSRPLARPSLSPSRSFFPFSLHPALALFLSLAPARSLDLVSLFLSLSVSPHLFLSLSLTLFPSCRIASLSDAGPLLFLSAMRSDRVFRGAKCVRGDLCPSVVPSLSLSLSLRLLLPQTLAIIARSILSSGFSPCRSLSTLSFGF